MMAPTKGPAPDLDVRAAEVPAPDAGVVAAPAPDAQAVAAPALEAGAAATHKLSEVEEELLLLCAAS